MDYKAECLRLIQQIKDEKVHKLIYEILKRIKAR